MRIGLLCIVMQGRNSGSYVALIIGVGTTGAGCSWLCGMCRDLQNLSWNFVAALCLAMHRRALNRLKDRL